MFGEVHGYELPPIPERVPDSMLLEDVSASLSLVRALESLAEQRTVTIDAGVEGMAALFGEMPPAGQGVASEDLMALLAPLVHAGVPVQMIPIQRAGEPNLLRGVRLLMWTPESVKPQRESEVDALAQATWQSLHQAKLVPESHPVWSERPYKVYLRTESEVRSRIVYVERNPMKEGLPAQAYPFVSEYVVS